MKIIIVISHFLFPHYHQFHFHSIIAGRSLKGKAFYNVQGNIYCKDDYLVFYYSIFFYFYTNYFQNSPINWMTQCQQLFFYMEFKKKHLKKLKV